MFLNASVILSTTHAPYNTHPLAMHTAPAMHAPCHACPPQNDMVNVWAVRILLECIFVKTEIYQNSKPTEMELHFQLVYWGKIILG